MRRLRPASPLRTPLRRLPRRERLNEPHLTRTGGSGARVGAVWGMDGRGVVLVGLLGRSGAGACPNLPQRRPAAVSAAKKSAEYQRFFSHAPARSGPLWQIWTTRVAANPREGRHGPVGGRDRPLGGPPQAGRRPQRAPRRANGARRPRRRPPRTTPGAETCTSHSSVQFQPSFSSAKCTSRRRSGPAAATADRDDDPAVHDDPDLQAAASGKKGSMRAQLDKIHLSSHDVSSARAM